MSAFKTFKRIAVFGSADVNDTSDLFHTAYNLSQLLAQAGVVVVNGGGPGVMLAATQGAKSVNGKTLTVSFHPKDAPFFEGPSTANASDENIVAENYPERLNLLLANSDAFVILNGGTGTLSEWATVWLMAHIHYGRHKPFVLVGEFWQELINTISRHMYISTEEGEVFTIVDTIEEVVPALQKLEDHLLAIQERDKVLTVPEEMIEDASVEVIGREPDIPADHKRGVTAVRQLLVPDGNAPKASPQPSRIDPTRYRNLRDIGRNDQAADGTHV